MKTKFLGSLCLKIELKIQISRLPDKNIYPVRDSQRKTVKKGFIWHICIQTHTEWLKSFKIESY